MGVFPHFLRTVKYFFHEVLHRLKFCYYSDNHTENNMACSLCHAKSFSGIWIFGAHIAHDAKLHQIFSTLLHNSHLYSETRLFLISEKFNMSGCF